MGKTSDRVADRERLSAMYTSLPTVHCIQAARGLHASPFRKPNELSANQGSKRHLGRVQDKARLGQKQSLVVSKQCLLSWRTIDAEARVYHVPGSPKRRVLRTLHRMRDVETRYAQGPGKAERCLDLLEPRESIAGDSLAWGGWSAGRPTWSVDPSHQTRQQ